MRLPVFVVVVSRLSFVVSLYQHSEGPATLWRVKQQQGFWELSRPDLALVVPRGLVPFACWSRSIPRSRSLLSYRDDSVLLSWQHSNPQGSAEVSAEACPPTATPLKGERLVLLHLVLLAPSLPVSSLQPAWDRKGQQGLQTRIQLPRDQDRGPGSAGGPQNNQVGPGAVCKQRLKLKLCDNIRSKRILNPKSSIEKKTWNSSIFNQTWPFSMRTTQQLEMFV